MSTQASYRLGEVGGYALDPDHEIPPASAREDLKPGEQAWLMIELPDRNKSAWAEVQKVLGPGWYLGRAENGDEVEFGSEHVFGINAPRFQMGAWYDFLPGMRREPKKPEASPPAAPGGRPAWYEFLPSGPRPRAKGESVFDVWKRGAPAEPIKEERKGFWDFFRRKPKVEVGPIPTAERRPERRSFLRLPGTVPEPPVPQPPPEPMEPLQEPPGPLPQAIILPEGPRGSISLPEGQFRPPDELFDVLAPEAPGPGLPPPAHARPSAMIVGPAAANLPTQIDAFSVLEPGPPGGFGPPSQIEPPSPFTMFTSEPATTFGMTQPAAPTPFDILEPSAAAPESGLVVRPEQGMTSGSVFDILEPGPAQPMTSYAPPEPGPTVFDPIEPRPPAPKPARKKSEKGRKRRQEFPVWEIPTHEEWIKFIQKTFKVNDLWEYIRKDRTSEYFIEEMKNYGEGYGEPAFIPVETWQDAWEFDSIFSFFGVPRDVWEPYAEAMAKEEEDVGYPEYAWERMQLDLLGPLEDALNKAFNAIKPSYLPGQFIMSSDDGSGTWGLVYWEQMDEKELVKFEKQAAREREADKREQEEFERKRAVQVKRIWGTIPKIEDLVPWIEETFDVDKMFDDIQKNRRQKGWKSEVKEYGEAVMTLTTVTDIGPSRIKDYEYDIAAYFGIPPDVVTLYEDSDSTQELWDDIFWPFFEVLGQAFTMLLPYANLPGMIRVDEDDEDRLTIQYVEEK